MQGDSDQVRRHPERRLALDHDGGQRYDARLRSSHRERPPCDGASVLEADADDIEFADGTFQVVGTDRAIPILELAQRMRATAMPDDLSGGLDNVAKFVSPQMSFPNGCHVCEVEIDRRPGSSPCSDTRQSTMSGIS